MDKQIEKALEISRLFENIDKIEYQTILGCLNAEERLLRIGQKVFTGESTVSKMGLIVSGCIDYQVLTANGNINLINRLYTGDSVGDVFAAANLPIISSEYICVEDTRLILLDVPRAFTEKGSCRYIKKYNVMENMLKMIAEDNIFMNKKIFILSQKKLRDKLLCYINFFKPQESKELWVPFNRQDLANFISADRSAVSRELTKMKNEKIIEIAENRIRLLKCES